MGKGLGIKRRWRRLVGKKRASPASEGPMARPPWSVVVEIIYQAALGRSPDPTGLAGYASAMSGGSISPAEALALVQDSAEGRIVRAHRTADVLIPALFNGLMLRNPSDDEMARWRGRLVEGASQADVVREVAATSEVSRAQLNWLIERQSLGALFLAEFRRRDTIDG